MKKILYILICGLMASLVLASKTNASFFDDWMRLIRGLAVTTTTKTKELKKIEDAVMESKTLCFGQELEFDNENQSVKDLQDFLCQNGFYKECLITGYFGGLTKKAVINFQNYYFDQILKPLGLLKATGYVGSATLKQLNKLTGCGVEKQKIDNIDFNINFKNDQAISNISYDLPDLIITDFAPTNWKELTEKDPEAMTCRLKPGNCFSYSPGHNRAWVSVKNIGKAKSKDYLVVIYSKQSDMLFGNTAKYVPIGMVKASPLKPGESKTYELYLLFVTSCFDGNVFELSHDLKIVVYSEKASDVIKKIEEQGEIAYNNDILVKLRDMYNQPDKMKVADFSQTEFAREVVKFKNSSEINSYAGFLELNSKNNEYATAFKCGSRVRSYDEVTKLYGPVAGQTFSNNRSFACHEGEGNYSLEECQEIVLDVDKLNLFLKGGKEPYIPRLTSYYCNLLTGQCIESNYTVDKLDGKACDYYKGPYRYYESGDGIDNDCTKECIREYSFYQNYQVNIYDWYACHPVLYNLFKVTDKVANNSILFKLTTTTTTKRAKPDTNTCYRCSYPHQACLVSSDYCDDYDSFWLDECGKFCKEGYELRGRAPWYTCDGNAKRCIQSLQQGPVFMSSSECKSDCKNNLNNLLSYNGSLPDLVTKIVDVETFPEKGFSIVKAKIKNIGGSVAICRLQGGQEAMFRQCVAGYTRSSVNCKQNTVWDDGPGCCKVSASDTKCLDNSFIYKKGSLDFKTGPGAWETDWVNETVRWKVEDNNSSKLEPGEEIDVTYQAWCIEKDNDISIVADPGKFESDSKAISSGHIGNFLENNFLNFPPFNNTEKWKYGNIKESNELNNTAYVKLGCAIKSEFCDGTSNPLINVVEKVNTY